MSQVVRVFSGAANEGRYGLLKKLRDKGPLAAKDLLGDFEGSQPHLSRQLAVLRESRLVTVERKGPLKIYTICEGVKGLIESAELLAEK